MRIYDNIAQLSTSTGTGNFTLSTTITGYGTFDDYLGAGVDYFPYLIEAIDGSGARTGEWESGIGLYSATNTLQRSYCTGSSDLGSPVSFAAGTKRVSLCLNSAAVKSIGCNVALSADDSGNYTTAQAISWGNESVDFSPAPFHDLTTNPSRLTIPPFARFARFSANLLLGSSGAAYSASLALKVNGSFITAPAPRPDIRCSVAASGVGMLQFTTPPISVVGGDYYELFFQTSGTGSVIDSLGSWFAVELVLR